MPGFPEGRLSAASAVAAARSAGMRLSRVATAEGLSASLLPGIRLTGFGRDGRAIEDLSFVGPS